MCGIAGIIALTPSAAPPDRRSLVRMASVLRHRGPDELGIYRDEHAGLAHTRLSIIDLSTGQQPMSTADGSLHIVFNGEIFNYVELRQELTGHGARFRTQSDTEVILEAYRAYGERAFERMKGQWALALWDSRSKKLVLSRDRQGIRPLHLLEHAGRLYFASEVKAIFASDRSLTRELDPEGLEHVFTFWGPVAPQGMFRGVSELMPAHVRTYEGGRSREHPYWRPRYPGRDGADAFAGSLEDATVAVRDSLSHATALRMLRSDVTVGSYLSGGLDSSLVAALAQRTIGGRLHTFSLRFADAEYDETAFQRMVANRLGSEHAEIVVSRADIGRAFPDTIRHTERPILRTAPTPLLLLSRLVRDSGIKVVLTGEGADEMFAGYDLFREGVVRRFWARHPDSELRPRLLERLYPYLQRSPVAQRAMARKFFGRELHRSREPGFAHGTRWQSTAALQRLFHARIRGQLADTNPVAQVLGSLPEEHSGWPPLATDQLLEVRTLMTAYILSSQGDRMLMASSVEGRFPFLDEDVVELANSLPPSYKLRVLDEKHVLKQASSDLLPRAVLERKKQPYRAPDALSFVGDDMPDWVPDIISESAVAKAGVFAPRAVTQLFDKCQHRASRGQFSNADNMAVVGVLSTQLLHQQLVESAPVGDPSARLTTDSDHSSPEREARP